MAFVPSKFAVVCARELTKCLGNCPGHTFGCLHLDNGGEFRAEFEEILKEKGILIFKSEPYSPQ